MLYRLRRNNDRIKEGSIGIGVRFSFDFGFVVFLLCGFLRVCECLRFVFLFVVGWVGEDVVGRWKKVECW